MEIDVRELKHHARSVIDAMKSGEHVTLTVDGEPVADIVPHRQRTFWLSGSALREELRCRSADAALADQLDLTAGGTLEVL